MPTHVAILESRYVAAILAGRKTVESRLSRRRLPPFACVAPGDLVFFKEKSGGFRALARVARVEFHDGLTPARVRELRARLGALVRGTAEYWRSRRDALSATLLWLADVEPVESGPDYSAQFRRAPRCAWFVLTGRDGAPAPNPCRAARRWSADRSAAGGDGEPARPRGPSAERTRRALTPSG